MIQESELEHRLPLASGHPTLPLRVVAPGAWAHARLRWGQWLVRAGRVCLVSFAAVALISTNREAGLLIWGALMQISSPVRGGLKVGVVFLLPPLGAALWLAGRGLLAGERRRNWQIGPWPVVLPLAILLLLSLVRLSPAIGWADVAFVLAGLGLLVAAYLFVLWDGLRGPALAAFVACVGGVQALVGIGQFVLQHDLGLHWLGEFPLSPSAAGASVLGGSIRILRAYGLMRHPNALGAILPLSLVAGLSLWLCAGRRQRILWLALIVVIITGLALSFSRAGWIAGLAGVAVLLIAGRGTGKPARRASDWTWAPAVLVIAAVAAGSVSLAPGLFAGRILGAFGAGSGLEHGSTSERFFSLQDAWMVIERWPWWGVGTRQYVLAVAQLIHVAPMESLLVESTPLVLWAELGVAAPLAWLGLGLALVWLGCRNASTRAANPDLALATGWIAAVQVVGLFQAFFWPTHELWQGSLWLGLALGLWANAWPRPLPRPLPRPREHAVPAHPTYRTDDVLTALADTPRPVGIVLSGERNDQG